MRSAAGILLAAACAAVLAAGTGAQADFVYGDSVGVFDTSVNGGVASIYTGNPLPYTLPSTELLDAGGAAVGTLEGSVTGAFSSTSISLDTDFTLRDTAAGPGTVLSAAAAGALTYASDGAGLYTIGGIFTVDGVLGAGDSAHVTYVAFYLTGFSSTPRVDVFSGSLDYTTPGRFSGTFGSPAMTSGLLSDSNMIGFAIGVEIDKGAGSEAGTTYIHIDPGLNLRPVPEPASAALMSLGLVATAVGAGLRRCNFRARLVCRFRLCLRQPS